MCRPVLEEIAVVVVYTFTVTLELILKKFIDFVGGGTVILLALEPVCKQVLERVITFMMTMLS